MSPAPAYVRKTSPIAGWKTFTSAANKYSISCPAGWLVTEGGGTLADSSPTANKAVFTLGFRPESSGPREIQYNLSVSHESLTQAVKWHEDNVKATNKDGSAFTAELTRKSYFTYDGHAGVRLDTTMTSTQVNAKSYSTEMYIAANGLLYKFDTQSHGSQMIDDSTVLGVFESLKIQ